MAYDWIVIGNGITGAAASYELARLGWSVVVVDEHRQLWGATRHSYGGIAYWAGTTPLMQQLSREGINRHRQFADELDYDTEFRELDLLLTVPSEVDPEAIAPSYANCDIPPRLISPQQAHDLEPLLNPAAISGAFTVHHGHVEPEQMVRAYNHGFHRASGEIRLGRVTGLIQVGDRVTGVTTATEAIQGKHVLVCAGGWSRHFLKSAGISVHQYFTHAESIESVGHNLQLRTMVMPANLQRFAFEAKAGHPDMDNVWDQPEQTVVPHILDAGALQFKQGQIRMGQISRALTNSSASINAAESERDIRTQVGAMLPSLQAIEGTWCHTLVAFSGDGLPLIGPLAAIEGLYLFSGFGSPFAIVPPLAQRFASHVSHAVDGIIEAMNPERLR